MVSWHPSLDSTSGAELGCHFGNILVDLNLLLRIQLFCKSHDISASRLFLINCSCHVGFSFLSHDFQ